MAEDDIAKIESRLSKLESKEKKWYSEVSTYVSISALLFSFGTTYVSYRRTTEQDVHNLRTELRGLIQRLTTLPRENLEAYKKYSGDPLSFMSLSGFIAQENNVVAKQAMEIINKLPRDQVTTSDYNAVASGMINSRFYDIAERNLKLAIEASNALDDEVVPLRILAALKFATGHVSEGRTYYQRAVEIFTKYPGYDAMTVAQTNVQSELNWASSEASVSFMDQAQQHIAQAEQQASRAPPGPNAQTYLMNQISQIRSQLAAGAQQPLVGSSSPQSMPVAVPSAARGQIRP